MNWCRASWTGLDERVGNAVPSAVVHALRNVGQHRPVPLLQKREPPSRVPGRAGRTGRCAAREVVHLLLWELAEVRAKVDSHKAPGPPKKRAPTLYLIIAIKLGKGLLLVLLAAGVYSLHDNNLPQEFQQSLQFFHLDPEKRFFTELANKLSHITPANVVWVARGTVLYSLFSLVEGFGLLFRVSWAGWLAIGESAFFIPIELYELLRHYHISLLVILGINVMIVWYLFQNRERLFTHHHHHKSG